MHKILKPALIGAAVLLVAAVPASAQDIKALKDGIHVITGKGGNIGVLTPCKKMDGSDGFVRIKPLLAQGRVRYVGEAMAFVVAETLNQAKDAVEQIFETSIILE